MSKAERTTAAKREAPDPIIQVIRAAEEALTEYSVHSTYVRNAQADLKAAAEELARATKAMSSQRPTTVAGAVALVQYAQRRVSPDARWIECIRGRW
jgi:hypothetical protein